MRWVLIFVALIGVTTSSLALREHYRTGTSPCSINDKWDCGIVNKSPYAVIAGVPVATIGIAGYILLAALALWKYRWTLFVCALCALGFSLRLTWIEWRVLEVWCVYCVINVFTILAFTLLALAHAIVEGRKARPAR